MEAEPRRLIWHSTLSFMESSIKRVLFQAQLARRSL